MIDHYGKHIVLGAQQAELNLRAVLGVGHRAGEAVKIRFTTSSRKYLLNILEIHILPV